MPFPSPGADLTITRLSVGAQALIAKQPNRTYAFSRFPNEGPRFVRRPGGAQSHRSSRAACAAEVEGPVQPPGASAGTGKDGAVVSQELFTPVNIPHDPEGVLSKENDPNLVDVLGQRALVVTREVEMLKWVANETILHIFLGFEQANRYALLSPTGQPIGYLAEEEPGILGGSLRRQLLRTHRPFTATLLSTSGQPLLLFKRNFTLVNSTVQVFRLDPSWDGSGYGSRAGQEGEGMKLIGESQQVWHPWRRKYDLFVNRPAEETAQSAFEQFARVDSGLLAWDFVMQDQDERLIGTINRNFRGFGRELFTDTGQYVLRFDSVAQDELPIARISQAVDSGHPRSDDGIGQEIVPSNESTRVLTLDERAVSLATAVSIDFDYFSRHSRGGSGGMFPFFWWGSSTPSEVEGGQPAPAPGAGNSGQDSRGIVETPGAPGQDAGGLVGGGDIGVGYGMMGGGRTGGEGPSGAAGSGVPAADSGVYPLPQEPGSYGQEQPYHGGGWDAQHPPQGGMDGWTPGPHEGIGGEEVWGGEEPWSESPGFGGSGESDGGGGGLFQVLWNVFGGDN
ncbi:Scramblase-domain-containing protein [Tilletiaria anomala UBC 951]|uniref:Scramblase-domain-containing protein n=1 Tax=Tilletiaria anomala (strain ATCC 24038 / CBS 436.72 / UBC 951) TaxID=1037660 RepID=A0A066VXM6_TILAU|nr:Scramblase-domain-containing protein [Tilletiaria anomala UBC 951]KDN46462.1 Scramblase-domain-containing protein [Tilletiaria anomala UBC 951]